MRLLGIVAGAELFKQAVYQFAAVLQKIAVGRIANLSVTACGINLHRTAMVIAICVRTGLFRLAAVSL